MKQLIPLTEGGAGASPGIRVIDTFTDTDGTFLTSHAPDQGNISWQEGLLLSISTPVAPAATIQGNALQLEGDENLVYFEAGSPDGCISMTWTPAAGQFNRNSLILRYESDGNMILVNVREDNGDISIKAVVADVTILLAGVPFAFAEGTKYTINAYCAGTQINVFINSEEDPLVNPAVSASLSATCTDFLNETKFGILRNAGSTATIVDDFSFVSIGGGGQSSATTGRIPVTSAGPWYVRSTGLRTDMESETDGQTNTDADAFTDWQTAIDVLAGKCDFLGNIPVVKAGDTATMILTSELFGKQYVGATDFILDGDNIHTLQRTITADFQAVAQNGSTSRYTLKNFTLEGSASQPNTRGILCSAAGSIVVVDNCTFGSQILDPMLSENQGLVIVQSATLSEASYISSVTASGSSATILLGDIFLTLTPNFTVGVLRAQDISRITRFGGAFTGTGAATGQQYSVSYNSVIRMSGGLFPTGTSGDTTTTGGQFAA